MLNDIIANIQEYPVITYSHGWINGDDQWGLAINTSDILDFLIGEVGQRVAKYKSDLFISWADVQRRLRDLPLNAKDRTEFFWFGLRNKGVDGEAFINSRIHNDEYISVYVLMLVVKNKEVSLTLYDATLK